MEKLSQQDLNQLAMYCLRRPTLGNEDGSDMTIKQFCDDLRAEMQYNREVDKTNGDL